MATMGVQWRQSPGGGGGFASLANSFAKSLFGDPDMDLKIAKMKADLALQQYQQAQYQSATDYNNARTAQQQAETSSSEGAAGAIAKILAAAQHPQGATSNLPVPVETPIPTPTPRPAPPAPVAIPPVTFQTTQTTPAAPSFRMPPTVPVVSDRRQFEPDFRMEPTVPVMSDTVPLQEDRASRFRLPVPISSPEPQGSSVDAAMLRVRPPIGAGPLGGDTLNALQMAMSPGQSLAGVPPELQPAPILTEDRLTRVPTPPVPPERPLGAPAVSVPGREPPPLGRPEGTPGMTIPGLPERTSTTTQTIQDRPPPVSPGYTPPAPAPQAAPTGREATGTDLPPGTPAPPAQVLPGTQPGTVAVQKANGEIKILDQEDLAALSRFIVFHPNAAEQTGQFGGELGILASPTMSPDLKAATLLEGKSPGRESMIGTDEAIRHDLATKNLKDRLQVLGNKAYTTSQGPNGEVILTLTPGQDVQSEIFSGDAAYAQNMNKIITMNDRLNRGEQLSPAELMTLYAATNDVYGDKTTSNFSGGQQVVTTIRNPIPSVFRSLDTLNQLASNTPAVPPASGVPAAAPAPAPAAPAPAAAAQPAQAQPAPAQPAAAAAPTLTQPTPAQPAPAPTQPREPFKNYGGWRYADEPPAKTTEATPLPGGGQATTVITGDKNVTPSGQESIRYGYAMNALQAMKQIDDAGTDVPGMFQYITQMLNQDGSNLSEEWIRQRLSDEKSRSFARAMGIFINSALARPESGAAVSNREWNNYYRNYAPPPGAKARDYVETKMFRNAAVKSLRLSLNGMMPPAALRDFDREAARIGIDLDWRPPAGWDQPAGQQQTQQPQSGDLIEQPDGSLAPAR